jgi:hypothetical protein
MKRTLKIFILGLIFFTLNSCTALYVGFVSNTNVQPHVRKEMIINEKRIAEERRKIDKIHATRKREIIKAQKKSWK